ncbi:hypothetical protein [Acidicapsa ligni]|uniref:hypothetical protein n=1 Tax=Acidicapsa ligni TaxID=542300 RepID=UPI0021E06CC7|nr:hypothetical protein [Acidicapsa ligni]
MNERVNPFAILKEAPAFTTKPKPEKPVETEALAQVAEDNNFTSRQAPKPAKKAERRKPRIHRTGRNVQFNTKATPETVARFYKLADEKKVTLGELFEMAIDALEREGAES